jgi:hypothetical protein
MDPRIPDLGTSRCLSASGSGRSNLAPIGLEAVWTPESVLTAWRGDK